MAVKDVFRGGGFDEDEGAGSGGRAAVLASTLAFAHSASEMKGMPMAKPTTMTGEVVDMGCYMAHTATGEKHLSCANQVHRQRHAMGLLTANGKLYLSRSTTTTTIVQQAQGLGLEAGHADRGRLGAGRDALDRRHRGPADRREVALRKTHTGVGSAFPAPVCVTAYDAGYLRVVFLRARVFSAFLRAEALARLRRRRACTRSSDPFGWWNALRIRSRRAPRECGSRARRRWVRPSLPWSTTSPRRCECCCCPCRRGTRRIRRGPA